MPDDFWADDATAPEPATPEPATSEPATSEPAATTPPDRLDDAAGGATLSAGVARLQRLFPGTVVRLEPRRDTPDDRGDGEDRDDATASLAAPGNDAVEP